ncbi:unnamed protein product [Taenia asiatica]|uniref:Aldo_ket_red domain-containing protein n=1 Tax=Taenia asiatica TaxID=60517 RepID=A0A0R3VZU4_TAEAS|nr:unnamed protein product [Taenia asiatica]VDK26660.1 unnamed protein product [Taenia asiatica]
MASPAAQQTHMMKLQQLYRTIDTLTDGQVSIVGIGGIMAKYSLLPEAGDFDPSNHFWGKSEDLVQLARNSVHLLASLPINGLHFTPNLAWIERSPVSGCLSSEEEEELKINEYANAVASGDEASENYDLAEK